jgi:hypothetical protein
MSLDKLIEAAVSVIFLLVITPVLFSMLYSISNPAPQVIINNTAVEQAQNLSIQLQICQKNLDELNKTVVTKQDLNDLYSILSKVNQNVVNIYETNNNYIKNYFSLTVALSISLGFTISVGLFTLLDITIFNLELSKGFIRVLRRKFSKKSD